MANADRKPRKRKDAQVNVELRLPRTLIQAIDYAVETGILGDTRSEVLEHVLRQAVFEQYMVGAHKEE